MAKITVGGKDIIVPGVAIGNIIADKGDGSRSGVSQFIKDVLIKAGEKKEAVSVLELSKMLVEQFKVTPEEEKQGMKSLPEDQARQRINSVTKGSSGTFVKCYTPDGYVAYTTAAALKALEKDGKSEEAQNGKEGEASEDK